MGDSDLISIIIPVFQNEGSIRACLESIVAQTYKNLEILPVCLESGDNTLAVIHSIRDTRIRIIQQKEKTGPGGARNLGLDAASGRYLGFVDADDWIDPDFYEKLHSAMLSGQAEIACAETRLEKTGPKKSVLFEHPFAGVVTGFEDRLRLLRNGAVFDKLFLAEPIRKKKPRFPESMYYEDNLWILQLMYTTNSMVMVKGPPYYHYAVFEKSDEHKARLKNDALAAARQMLQFMEEQRFSKPARKAAERSVLRFFLHSFIRRDKTACRQMREIFRFKLPFVKIAWSNFWKSILSINRRKRYFVILGRKFGKER